MPQTQFNWSLESFNAWVEEWQQWLGLCDPTCRKVNKARMIFSTLQPWLKRIINTRVAEGTQHQQTAPTLQEFFKFVEHCFHEYDPSGADERWPALSPRVVKGQVSLIDLEEFHTRWQCLLALRNEIRPQIIPEQLLSTLLWIKEGVVDKEAKNGHGSSMVDSSGLHLSPGRARFDKELILPTRPR